MKALSINQPWAWSIIYGGKTIENRKWNTNFRGQFWIHAGKRYDEEGRKWIAQHFPDLEIDQYTKDQFTMGGIIGVASVVDCVKESQSPWFFGPYGFLLEDISPVDFVPCRGMLNFFEPNIGELK